LPESATPGAEILAGQVAWEVGAAGGVQVLTGGVGVGVEVWLPLPPHPVHMDKRAKIQSGKIRRKALFIPLPTGRSSDINSSDDAIIPPTPLFSETMEIARRQRKRFAAAPVDFKCVSLECTIRMPLPIQNT